MKMIIKNLLSQRRRNIWLFIEMTVVAIVAWIVIDPVVVLESIDRAPLGYDKEKLVYLELGVLPDYSSKYSAEASDSAGMASAYDVMYHRLGDMKDVENVTPIEYGLHLDGGWSSMNNILSVKENGDSVYSDGIIYDRPNGYDYFTTYGIESYDGKMTSAELSKLPMGENDVIITESLAKELLGDNTNYLGKIINKKEDFDGFRVVGVVKDVRPWHTRSIRTLMWFAKDYVVSEKGETLVMALRLKDGVSPDSWVKENKEMLQRDFKAGNLYVKNVMTYEKKGNTTWQTNQATSDKRFAIALLVFFMINLALGVIGTFYLQTRQRSHDAGIMKSFGATKGKVYGMLFGEAMIVTVAGWLLGCLIYVNYALKEGLSRGNEWKLDHIPADSWIHGFWEHYAVISGIVLVVMVVIVAIGVSMPARRISRVNPVEAIRSE